MSPYRLSDAKIQDSRIKHEHCRTQFSGIEGMLCLPDETGLVSTDTTLPRALSVVTGVREPNVRVSPVCERVGRASASCPFGTAEKSREGKGICLGRVQV
jgi:hypothetical protein